jgi:hypothetical protein
LPFGFELFPAGALAGLVMLAIFGVGLGSLSYALAIAVRKQDWMFWMVQQTLTFPLMILSGMLLPIGGGPGWMQLLARFNPLAYLVDAERVLFAAELVSATVAWGWSLPWRPPRSASRSVYGRWRAARTERRSGFIGGWERAPRLRHQGQAITKGSRASNRLRRFPAPAEIAYARVPTGPDKSYRRRSALPAPGREPERALPAVPGFLRSAFSGSKIILNHAARQTWPRADGGPTSRRGWNGSRPPTSASWPFRRTTDVTIFSWTI